MEGYPRDNLNQLQPLFPSDGSIRQTSVDIVAVHGMETQSPKTWIAYEQDATPRGRAFNWLCDEDMLPHAVPQARIWAYNYNCYCYSNNAQEVDVAGLGDSFLQILAAQPCGIGTRPLLFIGSCFGGIVICQAIYSASQSGTRFADLLEAVSGVVFLGTPLRGTSVAKLTQWLAYLNELCGKQTTPTLLKNLEEKDSYIDHVVQGFAKLAITQSIPVRCFYETLNTNFARAACNQQLAKLFGAIKLVTKESACLDGHGRTPLSNARHAMMNKFRGPADSNFQLVSECLKEFADNANLSGNWNPSEVECMQCLSSTYREDKERNPRRVPGTCKWVFEHPKFIKWQSEKSALLLVFADPGCGKSVLAKTIVDEDLVTTNGSTASICYFFFKDEDSSRQDASSAISAILHQLFSQQPRLLKHAMTDFQKHGKLLHGMFYQLWDVLLDATKDSNAKQVICVIDALDECKEAERHILIDTLSFLYSSGPLPGRKLKILVTSRPYFDIDAHFYEDFADMASISLRGEHESEKISQEINLVIDDQIPRIARSRRPPLDQNIASAMKDKLKSMSNRTYLWLYLMFDVIRKSLESTTIRLQKLIEKLPRTVNEAYEKILDKVEDPNHEKQARRLLSIVLAAAKPLTLRELNIAFAIDERIVSGESCQSFQELDLPSEEPFRDQMRNLCGLFLRVVESKIYLLHLTAKEFLLDQDADAQPGTSISQTWMHSFQLSESHAILARVCVIYLTLQDINRVVGIRRRCAADEDSLYTSKPMIKDLDLPAERLIDCKTKSTSSSSTSDIGDSSDEYSANDEDYIDYDFGTYARMRNPEKYMLVLAQDGTDGFLLYAACHWVQHLRAASSDLELADLELVMRILDVHSNRFQRWFWIHIGLKEDNKGDFPKKLTGTIASSMAGSLGAVQYLLNQDCAQANLPDDSGQAPLHKAILWGYNHISRFLIEREDVDVNLADDQGQTPLALAVEEDNIEILTALLARSDIDSAIPDRRHASPLISATESKSSEMVRLLLKSVRCNVNASDSYGHTALHHAVINNELSIMKLLLKHQDIEVNGQSRSGWTALTQAVGKGAIDMTKLLLLHPKLDVNIPNLLEKTPLMEAVDSERSDIVRLLLKHPNVDVNKQAKGKRSPLSSAVCHNHPKIVRSLLKHPKLDVNAREIDGNTPLLLAMGRADAIVTSLLQHPKIDLNVQNIHGFTALMHACEANFDTSARLLLDSPNLDINMKTSAGQTAIFLAIQSHHTTIAELLLDSTDFDEDVYNVSCWAAQYGHPSLVTRLLGQGISDSQMQDLDDISAVLITIGLDDPERLKKLLTDRSIDLDVKVTDGEPLLFSAIRCGNPAIVEILLNTESKAWAEENVHGDTVGSLAIQYGDPEIFRLFLERDLVCARGYEVAALHLAAEGGHTEIITILLDDKTPIDGVHEGGETALHKAIVSGHEQTVDLLLSKGADVHASDKWGQTALHRATNTNSINSVRKLLANGASSNAKNNVGRTALYCAASRGYEGIAELLLAHGADVDAMNPQDGTALHIASQNGYLEIVQLLLGYGASVNLRGDDIGTALNVAGVERNPEIHALLKQFGARY